MLKNSNKMIWLVSWLTLFGLIVFSVQYYNRLNEFESAITQTVYIGNDKNSLFPIFDTPGVNANNEISTYLNPGTAAKIIDFYQDNQNVFWVFVEAESGSGWTIADNISFEK